MQRSKASIAIRKSYESQYTGEKKPSVTLKGGKHNFVDGKPKEMTKSVEVTEN
jgi:hypothetical protein